VNQKNDVSYQNGWLSHKKEKEKVTQTRIWLNGCDYKRDLL
jgi:hypothetical protein